MPLASASYAITKLNDGLTTFYQYAKHTSNTTAPTTGWSDLMPASEAGKFIWRREARALSLGLIGSGDWGGNVCLTGATGAPGSPGAPGEPGDPGRGVTSISVEYYHSTSETALEGGSWGPTIPTWESGKYVWTRSTITYTDTTQVTTDPICVTGPKGPMGNPGAMGVNTNGDQIMVSGFADDGTFGNPTGTIYLGSSSFQVNETTYTVTSNGHGYILANASGQIQFARLRPVADDGVTPNRMGWMEFNGGSEIVADAVIGEFEVDDLVVTKADMVPALSLDRFLRANFMEVLRNSSISDQDIQDMAKAMGADQIFQVIVAMEAFIKNLWFSRAESEIYSEDSNGYPDIGFHLDGIAGIAKIASLVAKNADIVGSFKSDGFRTLSVVEGTTIGTYTTPSTIFKYSEMTDLIPNSDDRVDLSGTVEGYTFTKATRRVNQRVRLHVNGSYSSTITASGGDKDPTIMSRITPIRLFGDNFYVQWHINYDGNFCNRRLWRTIPGQTARDIYGDNEYRVTINHPDGSTSVSKPYQSAGQLWSSGGGNGNYSGSYGINPANNRTDITLWVYSGALWGSRTATTNYMRVWTNSTYNGLVLTNGDTTFNVVGFQPDAYYLSSSKAFTIGSTNQDSTSMKKYKSGTDFYNRFSAVPVGTNSACSGVVRVNGTSYTVTRMKKDEDRITFYTGTQEVVIRKFVNGTSTGVYTDLAITTAVVLGKVDGGIESMWIIPWAHALYDIGQTTKRFRSMYLSGEMVSGSVNTGPVSASTITATTINGTALNLGGSAGYAVRAWANSNNGSMRMGQGISSTARRGTGVYRFNLSPAMPDTNYAVVGMARDVNTNDNNVSVAFRAGDAKTTTYFDVTVSVNGYYDTSEIDVIVLR
jgi:hypothetical protein